MKEDERQKRIEDAVRSILKEFRIDEQSETFQNTPRRVAKMYLELFSGMDGENEPQITVFDNPGYRDILSIKKIPFYSMCTHHLLPMFGYVSIAYIPHDKILGLSKFPRIVKYFASKLQVQEEFTKELTDYLYAKLGARGVMVMVNARHLCMEMRGVKTHDVEAVSSAIRGSFETNPSTKEEALRILMFQE
jgi:GTP cyclohydrolase I